MTTQLADAELPQRHDADHHAGDAETGDRGPVLAQIPPPEHGPRERRADDGERDEQAERSEQVGDDDHLRAHGEGAVVHGGAMIAPAPVARVVAAIRRAPVAVACRFG